MSAQVRDLRRACPVVVGVDGSDASLAAVRYAGTDAADTGRPLLLVGVVDDPTCHAPNPSSYSDADHDWALLDHLGEEAAREHPGLRVRRAVEFDNPVRCLLAHSRRADRLVVGRRGLGAFPGIMLGSTSTDLAARSDRPVIIVPAGWQRDEARDQRIVVGADLDDPEHAALRFAFEEAQRRGAALDVVHVIDVAPVLGWDTVLAGPTYRHPEAVGDQHLEDVVEPFQAQFPTVPVVLCDQRGNPATVLLHRSHRAQLLVIGRRFPSGLGSTSRAVLRYAELPLAVVPS